MYLGTQFLDTMTRLYFFRSNGNVNKYKFKPFHTKSFPDILKNYFSKCIYASYKISVLTFLNTNQLCPPIEKNTKNVTN